MPVRNLVYQGSRKSETGEILVEGEAFLPGDVVALKRRRSPWDPSRPVERIILGSNPARADVLVKAAGIEAEHVRFYLPVDGCGENDLELDEVLEDLKASLRDSATEGWLDVEEAEEESDDDDDYESDDDDYYANDESVNILEDGDGGEDDEWD